VEGKKQITQVASTLAGGYKPWLQMTKMNFVEEEKLYLYINLPVRTLQHGGKLDQLATQHSLA